jgi:hypothetical protein
LGVGHDLAVGCINTRVVSILGIAGLEDIVLGIVGSIVSASDTIVNVLAKFGGVGASGVARFEAEGVGANEVSPLHHLNVRRTTTPCVREHDASHGVTTEISTMGVHLTTVVIRQHEELSLVHEANDLDVVGGPQELDTSQSASGNETSTVARFAAPGDHLAFDFTNGLPWLARGPETKIIQTIEKSGLAQGILVLGRRITNVVASLNTANEAEVGVDFIWNSRGIRKMFRCQRCGGVGTRNLSKSDIGSKSE